MLSDKMIYNHLRIRVKQSLESLFLFIMKLH